LDKNKTNLAYSGNAQVGGKLAQVGSRLIGGVIKNTADDFFNTFNNNITNKNITDIVSDNKNTIKDNTKPKSSGISYWVWIGSLIIIIGIILAFFT